MCLQRGPLITIDLPLLIINNSAEHDRHAGLEGDVCAYARVACTAERRIRTSHPPHQRILWGATTETWWIIKGAKDNRTWSEGVQRWDSMGFVRPMAAAHETQKRHSIARQSKEQKREKEGMKLHEKIREKRRWDITCMMGGINPVLLQHLPGLGLQVQVGMITDS